MKYCFNYSQKTEHSQYINEIDEWTITYNPKDSTLLEFLDLHKDKRINLLVEEELELKFLIDLCEKYDNLYLKLSLFYKSEIDENGEKPRRFFFDTWVSDWDTFMGLVEYNVTDIHIAEGIGFEVDKAAEIAHSKGIQLRAFPNVAQSSWDQTPALKKFFIRPEDVEIYSKYIDVFEFYCEDEKLDTYYKIYAKDKKWFGKLNEIITSFNSELDSRYIIPKFAEKRVKCGKSCLKGGHCRRCDRIDELSKSLEKSGLIVKIDN